MNKIYLIAIFLTGCAATAEPTEEELEPMQRSYETPEQFKQRKELYCQMQPSHCWRHETPEQFEQRKELENSISSQRKKDMDICRYEATKATASSQRGYTVYSTIFNDVGDTFRQAELIELCLQAKGYGNK